MVLLTMEKEGLQTAIDFTKLLMALAGGGIALIIQPHFLDGGLWLKVAAVAALISLSVCVVSGLLVVSGGAVRLAEKKYNLNFRYIKVPGQLSVASFGLGFVLLSIIVGFRVVFPSDPSTTAALVTSICPKGVVLPTPVPIVPIPPTQTPKGAASSKKL